MHPEVGSRHRRERLRRVYRKPQAATESEPPKMDTLDSQGRNWYARRDSNARPLAPEASTLSS